MNIRIAIPAVLALALVALQPAAYAGDKKKGLSQQELQQQWKLQQMQQQQQAQQAVAAKRKQAAAAGAGRPWIASRGGSGNIQAGKQAFAASSVSATLSNFWGVNGPNNSGAASITLNGGQFTFRGTWTGSKVSQQVWLSLGSVTGTLSMSGASGTALQSIVLNGTANGAPFAANFR